MTEHLLAAALVPWWLATVAGWAVLVAAQWLTGGAL